MCNNHIRLLLVEGNPEKAHLLEKNLSDACIGKFDVTNVNKLDDVSERMSGEVFDIVLLNLSLPESCGLDTFNRFVEYASDIPVVVISSLKDEESAVKAVQCGAQDYLIEGRMETALIVKTLSYSIDRNRTRKELEMQKKEMDKKIAEINELRDLDSIRFIELSINNERLHKAMEEAAFASRTKGELLANMRHEIRTPMNAIIGLTELLLEDNLSPEQKENMEVIKQSADSLLALLNSILNYSDIETGKEKMKEANINIKDMIEKIIMAMSVLRGSKDLDISYHIDPDVPSEIKGDPENIRQIIVNLVVNAIKFTERGEIIIKIGCPARENKKRNIKAGYADRNVMLHFSVSDTGIGIPEESFERIFESFVQGDGAINRKYGGTGIGLTICKEIVSMMNGKIWVESEPGKGSTFHFTARFGRTEIEKNILAGHHCEGRETMKDQENKNMIHKDEAIERLGDEELFWQVCEVFLDDAPRQMKILKGAIDDNDMALACCQAHSLKSAAANIGAETVRERALKIEETAKAEDLSNIQILYEDIENEMNKVLRELQDNNCFETITEV